MSASAGPTGDARALRLAALGVILLALLPSLGTLGAPWIAEDAALLAWAEASGPWADWTQSQGGLLYLPRFWRPLVSTSWDLQASWSGIAPVPLRLFNLGLHALAALLALGCARRLGASPLAAGAAGAWVALFPEQGGTSTWLAGRTDLLGGTLLLASTFAALGPRPLRAAPLAFLACASKEFGFLAPLWIALLAWGRGAGAREVWRRVWPAGVAVLVAFAWRRLALGGFGGGYAASLPAPVVGLAGSVRATFVTLWPSLAMLAPFLVWGLLTRAGNGRGVRAALAAAALATGLLYPLLADGYLEPENRRLFYVPECALGLAFALALERAGLVRGAAGRERRGARTLAWLALVVLVPRGVLAFRDTRDWARSAHEGEAQVARVRAALAELAPPSTPAHGPVVVRGFPPSRHDAYCLGYGLAARFRAPFPVAPRPVWPWRLTAVHDARREREPLVAARAPDVYFPCDDAPRVTRLALADESGAAPQRLPVDERSIQAAEDRSPRLVLAGGPARARLEAVLACELGYEPFPLASLDERGAGTLSLMQLLASTNGALGAGELLMQAADLGATRAFVELRALDPDGAVAAASSWLELRWSPELLALVLNAP